MGVPLDHRDSPSEADAEGEGHREENAVVTVELDLGQEVGGGDAEEATRRQCERGPGHRLLPGTEQVEARGKDHRPQRDRRGIDDVDHSPEPRRPAGGQQQSGDDAGVQRLVQRIARKVASPASQPAPWPLSAVTAAARAAPSARL
jgi:hypothetical protein